MALFAAPLAAKAQPFQGLYIGAGAGYNMPANIDVHTHQPLPSSQRAQLRTEGGVVGLASVGYGLGNGFRFEVEGNFRQIGVNHAHGQTEAPVNGNVNTYGVMANALYDMD